MAPGRTPVFHFTHIDNLRTIATAGGLRNLAALQGTGYVNSGNREIKDRRASRSVECPPFGLVADYVPFYFAPRSPMLFALHKGAVPGCSHGQDALVYLVAIAEELFASLPCCFTDRNATLLHATFYNDPARLADGLDWETLGAKMWKNTATDTDRKERRMAEFLVKDFVPWRFFRGICVYGQDALQTIRDVLAASGLDGPATAVRRDWYF